jgi:hypothetical protein
VVDRAAHLAALGLALVEHRLELLRLDRERDVQVENALRLELERRVGHIEEGEEEKSGDLVVFYASFEPCPAG